MFGLRKAAALPLVTLSIGLFIYIKWRVCENNQYYMSSATLFNRLGGSPGIVAAAGFLTRGLGARDKM